MTRNSYGPKFGHVFAVPPDDILNQAACKPAMAEWFWPIGDSDSPVKDTKRAQKVCSRCPVIRACGQYALDNGITDGVWGGMRPAQLRRLILGRIEKAPKGPPVNPSPTCWQGHPMDEGNTYVSPSGKRECHQCRLTRSEQYRAKRRKRQLEAAR